MTNNDEMPPCQPQPDIDSERPRITGFICGRGCINGEHQWDGPEVRIDHGGSVSCSKCGMLAIDVDLWEMP